MSLKHPIVKSFPYAFEGIKTAFRNEPNFRVHLVMALLVMVLGNLLGLSSVEFAVLILTIGFVITLELINTMLEALVDLVSPEIKPHAKIAKDVSAAAVLTSATVAAIVGVYLFLPKILILLG